MLTNNAYRQFCSVHNAVPTEIGLRRTGYVGVEREEESTFSFM